MTPSFRQWIVRQANSGWQRASVATKWKINLVLLGVFLAVWLLPPVITVLAAGAVLAYAYNRYCDSVKYATRDDDSRIHTYIGDSLSDDSLRWAITTWARRYRP